MSSGGEWGIEITPAMISAGVSELHLSEVGSDPSADIVRDIFVAMCKASPAWEARAGGALAIPIVGLE
jgi:hypothetical protein